MRRLFILFILCAFQLYPVFCNAQVLDETANTENQKKPWYLTFNFDLELKNIAGSYKDYYQGEYFTNDFQVNRDDQWSWVEVEKNNKKLFPAYKYNNMKLDVMIGRSRSFRFGMSYTFGLLEGRDQNGYYDIHSYLAICGIAEYQYNFIKTKEIGPFAFGSLAFGPYRGTSLIEGQGTELFGQAKLGVGFEAPKGWMLRLWGTTDYLYYRENSQSQIFKREQKIKTDINIYYLGIGFTKQVTLIPD